MKRQIYNAIQKQLVIDSDDANINYNRSQFTNECNNLIINNIDELYQLFKDKEDIFQYDTEECLSLIFADGSEKSISMADGSEKFMKLKSPELSGNNILILLDDNHGIPYFNENFGKSDLYDYVYNKPKHLCYDSYDALQNMSGYENTMGLIDKINRTHETHSAAKYCTELIHTLKNGDTYKGYIPALGQLNVFYRYNDMFNYIFKKLGFKQIKFDDQYISSTEKDVSYFWTLIQGEAQSEYKLRLNKIMPFFWKI